MGRAHDYVAISRKGSVFGSNDDEFVGQFQWTMHAANHNRNRQMDKAAPANGWMSFWARPNRPRPTFNRI